MLLLAFPTILSCPASLPLLPLSPSAFPAFSPPFVRRSPLRLCYSFCCVPHAGAFTAPPSASPAPPASPRCGSSRFPSRISRSAMHSCCSSPPPQPPPPHPPHPPLPLLLLQKQFWPALLPNNEALTSFPWEKISQPNTSHWQELFLIFSLFPSPIAPA